MQGIMKRKLKETSESESVTQSDENSKKFKNDVPAEEELPEIGANFNIKKFRENLKIGNFYDDLKLFIKKAAKSPDIIQAFIDAGGKALEIVEIIKNNEESSLEIVSNLYHMLRMIIFCIANDEGQRIDPTVQALKFLVNRNKLSIEKMLASSKISDKILMLKILSIATSLDSEIGRDILKNIDVFAKSTENDNFSILEDIQKKTKTPYEDSVRLAFVHFMLGFLYNDKDIILRKKILQKRSLFEFFLRDIHQDNCETIKSIITCLTKNVLIPTSFNKPEKLKIFTDNAIKSLLKLYEWKGKEDEKSTVVNIAHQFLLLLLTSKKHGIVFKALSEKRQNLRQLQVIGLFKNVWNLEYPSMLVIEIIKSCPDLMQNVLNRLVMGLQPKVTTQWFMCANFTKELIKILKPATMINSFSMLEPKKISTNIIKLSISQFILQNINERALIQQDNLEVRESSVELLYVMMDHCCKYLDEVRKMSTLKDFEKHRIKFDIINHIFTFYPNIDIILNSLYRSINLSSKKKSDGNEKLVKSQLKNTLEILLLVIKNFPSIIEKIPSVIDYLEVLRPIYEYQLTSADDVNNNEDLEIEMKVVKIILFLQPRILSLESEMFQRVFLVLIQVYCCSASEDYKNEAKNLLTGVLNNTNVFQSTESIEISIWLETFKSVKRGILKESASTFVKVLQSCTDLESEKFKWGNQDNSAFGQKNLKSIDICMGDSSKSVNTQQELSHILPAFVAMKSNKINRIIEFAEIAIILLYQSHPQMKKSFIELLQSDHVELNSKIIIDYLKKKSLTSILDFCGEIFYKDFQQSFITGEKIEIKTNDIQQLELLIMQAIFCAIQLNKSGNLDEHHTTLLVSYIEIFYKRLLEGEKRDTSLSFNDEKLQEPVEKKVNKICNFVARKPSDNVINYIFNQQTMILDGFSISKPNQLTKLVSSLSQIFNENPIFERCSSSYRNKIISELEEIISAGKMIEDVSEIVAKFPLDETNCLDLLNIVSNHKGSVKEFHIKLLKILVGRIVEINKTSLSTEIIQKVEKVYVDAVENTAIDTSELEKMLFDYLSSFPHNIGDLSEKLFLLVFREDQTATKSFVRLITTVFTRNDAWNEIFKAKFMKLKKELMYPLLSVALTKGIIPNEQLRPIYNEFKSGILKAIEKPNKAAQIYRENIQTSLNLIRLAMPLNECLDLAMKKFKFDATDVYQIKMLHEIFKKAFQATPDDKIYNNFLNHWLQLFGLSVSKSSYQNEQFFDVLQDWLNIRTLGSESASIVNGVALETFYKTCLKTGLKSKEGSKMLVLLGKIVRSTKINAEEIVNIFDMILTHSNFFNVVFNFKTSGNEMKKNLFFLLNILVQKNPSVAHEKHVPILLSAYQATMTSSDQLILNLLRFYELRCDIDFYDYRPFLFGPTALAHFSTNEDQETKLIKKNVDDMNVVFAKLLNAFDKSTLENTVNNYPIQRQLAGVPSDELDKLLLDETEADNIYDPGYFLPIFEMVLVSSTFNFISAAVKNNLLSLIIPALSCEDENMRLLAAHIILKCRETNESRKSTKDIWIRFYDSIQYGYSEITEGTKIEEKPNEKHFPRAASISTQMLAEFVKVLPNSLHNAYPVVANYFAVSEKFDFSTIPELLVLFHNSDVQQLELRLFLLEIIFNGIKDGLDFKLLNNTSLLKMIFSCYACPLSDRKIDFMILKIIDRLVTKTGKIEILIQRYGLPLWIYEVSVRVEAFEYDAIEVILKLIEHTADAVRKELKNGDDESHKRLLCSLFTLLGKFTKTKLTATSFTRFLKTVNTIANFNHITKEDHEIVLELIKIFLTDDELHHITYLIEHPEACKFTEAKEDFSKTLSSTLDATTKSVLLESREFLLNCYRK